MEQSLASLMEEVKYELFHYPESSIKQDIKYLARRLLKPKDTPKRDSFFWTHALLAQALQSAGEISVLKKYYDVWIEKGIPVFYVDHLMHGYSLLYLYETTGEEKYRKGADRLYEYARTYAKEMGNLLPYRRNHPTHVYADGLGMTVPFLCRYGASLKNREACELGILQIRNFFQNGMEETTGLPYHGYDSKNGEKQGIIGWGRAVGWLMLAMADSQEYIQDEAVKEEMAVLFGKLTRTVLSYQRKDGYFSWQLQALEGPKDTSATALIGYALKKFYSLDENKNKINKEEAEKSILVSQALEQIRGAILNSVKDSKIYDCSGECEGFGRYPQIYGAYPWSLGPGVRFLLEHGGRVTL